ncbi:MAG TPA: hypothetical protein VFA69_09755 [Candidatus Nitrosotalea sp.]|nr:hypothetical protein [Candidatus Nitrosotalea sp.]
MFSLTAILSIVAILTTSTIAPILALGDTVQQIHSELAGFTVMSDCCSNSTVHVQGSLITQSDGTMELSSQNGVVTIGSVSYALKFEPTSKTTVTPETNVCASGISYEQSGEVELTGTDGAVLKGSGVYSWGHTSGCPDGDSSFTYFSGNVQSKQGQTIEFFTGTDSLPIIQ